MFVDRNLLDEREPDSGIRVLLAGLRAETVENWHRDFRFSEFRLETVERADYLCTVGSGGDLFLDRRNSSVLADIERPPKETAGPKTPHARATSRDGSLRIKKSRSSDLANFSVRVANPRRREYCATSNCRSAPPLDRATCIPPFTRR